MIKATFWSRVAAAALLVAGVLRAGPSHALQYQRIEVGDGKIVIAVQGVIVEGDTQRLW
ncbi:MAG: hypothetical protein JO110_09530, partial [Acetobacteraceae bacterium]|nr:hypothetical protein [Acetobacteraceae bacterium]